MSHCHCRTGLLRRLVRRLLRRTRHHACTCLLVGRGPVTVRGDGSEQQPYIIGL